MTEPITVNCLFTTPNTGDLTGAWGTAAVNPVITAIDGRFGGVTSISLSNASVTLTQQNGTATPGAGPTQSDNAVIKFSGTLTANCVVTFPLPGVYIVQNNCGGVGSFYIQARAAGTGNMVGLPDGRAVKVWNDGTNVDFCDPPEVATYHDMAVSTTPKWMNACSVLPYLLCNGSTFNSTNYTALSVRLGSTFGGNGVTTFGVPDLKSRLRLPLANMGTTVDPGRVTNAISGINATTLGASGGSQSIQAHTHTASVTDPGHTHTEPSTTAVSGSGASDLIQAGSGSRAIGTASTGITVSNATTGSGGSQNMPPVLVAGLVFIKT